MSHVPRLLEPWSPTLQINQYYVAFHLPTFASCHCRCSSYFFAIPSYDVQLRVWNWNFIYSELTLSKMDASEQLCNCLELSLIENSVNNLIHNCCWPSTTFPNDIFLTKTYSVEPHVSNKYLWKGKTFFSRAKT